MKPVYFTFALIFLVATNGFSQDSLQVTPHMMAETITNRIDSEIKLTSEQRLEVYQLLVERSKGYDQTTKKYKSNKSKIGEEKAKIDLKANAKFKKILSKEQYEDYEKIKKQNEEQKRGFNNDQPYLLSEEDDELDF
jgi:hypothetical protein